MSVRTELVATTNQLKCTEGEVDMTRVELVQTQANVLKLENELSVAQQAVRLQEEGFRDAQKKVTQYRMESQSFFESQQELAEKFGRLSLRYEA